MSASELSTLIKKHILPALDKDLRSQLDAAVQDLEIDPKTTKTNIREHFQCSRQQANKIFNFIIGKNSLQCPGVNSSRRQ